MACGSFKRKKPPEIRGTGYVVKTLEAALWAFHTSESFQEGCLKAVNLGEDADTTGAVFGQLAGAVYGMCGIPGDWYHAVFQWMNKEERIDWCEMYDIGVLGKRRRLKRLHGSGE